MENTLSMEEQMDEKVFISRQSWHFPSVNNIIKVLLPICISICCVNNYDSREGKSLNKRNESSNIII